MSNSTAGLGAPAGASGPAPPFALPNPDEWNGTASIVCATISLVVATAAVALRFWARAGILHVVALEDWFILLSLALSAAATGCLGVQLTRGGLGKHVAYVTLEELTVFFEISLVDTILYVLALGFTKLSVLCLYIRVLTYDRVRLAAKIMLGVVVISHIYIIICLLTACIPLSAFWDFTPARANAYCHPMSIYWSHAGLNIVTDFLIFLLPLTVLHKIRSPRPQKIALVVIFLLAFIVCIISLVRAFLLKADLDAGATDVTWDAGKTANWNIWEVNIAILCACLTTMKPVVARFFPRVMSSYPSTMPDQEEINEARGPRAGRRQFEFGGTGFSTVDGDGDDVETGLGRESKEGRSQSTADVEVESVKVKAG